MCETSVIIRTFNEERFLPALLNAIKKQDYDDYEVIVVDSGSYDSTREIAVAHGARLVDIDSRDFTFGFSLNAGINNAKGKYVAIVSAHTEPASSNWLRNLVQPLRNDSVAMVYGRQEGTEESKVGERRDFLRQFGREYLRLEPPNYFANNANSAIKKDLWCEYPFDEALPGLEDIDWAKHWMERGMTVLYEPEASIYHIHIESWRQIRHRYYREALAAKWIDVRSRLDIFSCVWHEVKWLVEDLLYSAWNHRLKGKGSEIFLFRACKLAGTLKGLWNRENLISPARKEAIFFDQHFRAVVIEGPHRARLKEVAVPEVKPGDVLIKIAYEGICATDIEILEGTLGYYATGLAEYPIVPGHEFSGRIIKVGPNVKGLKKGDPVVGECIQSCGRCGECDRGNAIGCESRREVGVIGQDGAYAEFVVLPAHFIHKLPEDMDLKVACLCEPTAVVLKGLKRIKPYLERDSTIRCAVVGLGSIGHISAQLLAMNGNDVTGFDRNPLRRGYVEETTQAIAIGDNLERLDGFEIIVEATGDPDVLDTILRNTSAGATILLLGLPYARRPFNFESIVAFDKAIVGSVGSAAEDFRKAIQILPSLDLFPFLQQSFPLDSFEAGWEASKSQSHLKTILEIDASLNDVQTSVDEEKLIVDVQEADPVN